MATVGTPAPIDELSVIREAQEGDSAAHATLIRLHEKQVFNIASRITKSREDAEDVVQEVFITVFKRLRSFQGRSKFSTWLYRVTLNTSLIHLRRARSFNRCYVEQDWLSEPELSQRENNIPDLRLNPEQTFTHAETSRLLARAMSRLRPSLRSVLVMRDVQGLSIEETAATLNLSISAVKTRLVRARLAMRELMIAAGAVTSCLTVTRNTLMRPDDCWSSSGDD